MIDPNWRFDPKAQVYVSDVLHAFIPADGDDLAIVDWTRRKGWFDFSSGIGNSLHMWWPSRRGPRSAWLLCVRCGVPFNLPTGFHLTVPESQALGRFLHRDIRWTGGPCSHCAANAVVATGRPLLIVQSDGNGITLISGSHPVTGPVERSWRSIARALENGELGLERVAAQLRSANGSLAALASWLEASPIDLSAAASIVHAITQTVGPLLELEAEYRASAEGRIANVVELVLNHYEQTRSIQE